MLRFDIKVLTDFIKGTGGRKRLQETSQLFQIRYVAPCSTLALLFCLLCLWNVGTFSVTAS